MDAIVLCATCNLPGIIVFNDDGVIKKALFCCKCPRPSVEEANKINAKIK